MWRSGSFLSPVLLQWWRGVYVHCGPGHWYCALRDNGVSHCILEPGGAPRKVEQGLHRPQKSRVWTESGGGGWKDINQP